MDLSTLSPTPSHFFKLRWEPPSDFVDFVELCKKLPRVEHPFPSLRIEDEKLAAESLAWRKKILTPLTARL
jgi:hypothetical protein